MSTSHAPRGSRARRAACAAATFLAIGIATAGAVGVVTWLKSGSTDEAVDDAVRLLPWLLPAMVAAGIGSGCGCKRSCRTKKNDRKRRAADGFEAPVDDGNIWRPGDDT